MSTIENTPKKFRKKPVTIEAMRFAGTPAEAIEVYHWIERNTLVGFEPTERITGEFYPCKPEIFAATYEEVRP